MRLPMCVCVSVLLLGLVGAATWFPPCKEGSFRCDGWRCVHNSYKCDGVAQCRDGADEADCTRIRTLPACAANYRCNGIVGDCWADADELDCTPEMCQPPATREAYSGRRCRDPNARCNGVLNFPDERDEHNCTACNGGAFFCDGRCFSPYDVCDGRAHCSRGEDELNCTSCKSGSFLCDGSRCVHNRHKCDGVAWCRDGSDEANCPSIQSEPFCDGSLRCNGVQGDCWTDDDELHCSPEMCQTPASSNTYCDGRCLQTSSWCDGRTDCSGGEDEAFGCSGRLLHPLAYTVR